MGGREVAKAGLERGKEEQSYGFRDVKRLRSGRCGSAQGRVGDKRNRAPSEPREALEMK